MIVKICEPAKWKDLVQSRKGYKSNFKNIEYFPKGRYALNKALHDIRKLTGKSRLKVLIPVSLCAEAAYPFGLGENEISYYSLELDLNVDTTSLSDVITEDHDVMLLVRFMGFQNCNYEQVVEICRRNGVLLIDDLAHFLGAPYFCLKNMKADYAIMSLHKLLPIKRGGVLITKGTLDGVKPGHKYFGNRFSIVTAGLIQIVSDITIIIILKRWILGQIRYVKSKNQNVEKNCDHSLQSEIKYELSINSIDDYSRALIDSYNYTDATRLRRANYLSIKKFVDSCVWATSLRDNLEESDVPYMYPLVTECAQTAQKRFMKYGIDTEIFMTAPVREHDNCVSEKRISELLHLSKRLLGLPLHPRMTGRELKLLELVLAQDG